MSIISILLSLESGCHKYLKGFLSRYVCVIPMALVHQERGFLSLFWSFHPMEEIERLSLTENGLDVDLVLSYMPVLTLSP
jgi:hypothetical protein